MSSRMFGWDLPPGVSMSDIDKAVGANEDEYMDDDDSVNPYLDPTSHASMLGQIRSIISRIPTCHLDYTAMTVAASVLMALCDKLADDLFQEPDEHEAYEKAAGDGL